MSNRLNSIIQLIKRGATEGERQAAREAYIRIIGREYSESESYIHISKNRNWENYKNSLDPHDWTEEKNAK